MFGEGIPALWSAVALLWWIAAWRLVKAACRQQVRSTVGALPRSLSIFKPLPPLGSKGITSFAAGLESFAAQMDDSCDLLLGAHSADMKAVQDFVATLRVRHSSGRITIVPRSKDAAVSNPKIDGQMTLAPHAKGELWLWSDADIIAPPGFLAAARHELANGGAGMVTYPYFIRRVPQPSAWLETLFVNVEFLPGVLLLGGLGRADFGLGAGMLFERVKFEQHVDWEELGSYLADDFQLGQRLKPVRIGAVILETVAADDTWARALGHDLRWSKTVRWNRPGGFFARLAVLPVLGWLLGVMIFPRDPHAWAGLIGMVQIDVIAAAFVCRAVGCRVRWRDVPWLEFWGLWRIAVWLLCWLPGPVMWSGRAWHSPQSGSPAADRTSEGSD